MSMSRPFNDPTRKRAFSSPTVVFAVLVVVIVAAFAGGSYLIGSTDSFPAPDRVCDKALSRALGPSTSGLCLQNVQLSVSSSNVSQFIVPVMVMKPGTTTTVDILYLLGSETVGHKGPIQNVTTSDFPEALSVPSGKVSGQVVFTDPSVLSSGRGFIIYRYAVAAAAGSTGYYAILPPFYFGAYPALAVGAQPDLLNQSALTTWGYDGVMQSAEFAIPSEIVGTGSLALVNATVPAVPSCTTPACVIISHSGT